MRSTELRILIAPDSFKGSLSSSDVAEALAEGWLKVWPQANVHRLPLADGGEGTVEAMVDATGGRMISLKATGPLGEPVSSFYGILGDRKTAVIEMAAASGLPLVPAEQRNPLVTTTRGTGELIRHALDQGCRRFVIGLGGSATNDGGVGMAQALGASFRDHLDRELADGGAALADLASIDLSGLDPRITESSILVACDVDNPLTGPQGASAVYGPQKGATPQMVEELDQALARLAHVIEEEMGIDVDKIPGAGAAGGMGAGLAAFLGARLKPGIEIVLEAVGFDKALEGADLVITGEGALDAQTAFGKAPKGVADAAVKKGVPVVAVAGSVADDAAILYEHGFDAIFSCTPRPMSLDEAVLRTRDSLVQLGEAMARLYRLALRSRT